MNEEERVLADADLIDEMWSVRTRRGVVLAAYLSEVQAHRVRDQLEGDGYAVGVVTPPRHISPPKISR